ncbi:MAG: fatty acid desaturase family protein [Nocardioides sp.]
MTVQTIAPPASPLTTSQADAFGRELDALRERVLGERGAADAAYIRRVITAQRLFELIGRVALLASGRRSAWWVGTTSLALSKILDNMEIGHNVLHGQWDWMRDPKIHSSTWDWDHTTPPDLWQRSHNQQHHAYTNILGQDNDLGYGILRVDEAQPWDRRHLAQPLLNLVNALVFEYGIAAYDLELGTLTRGESEAPAGFRDDLRRTVGRAGRQARKELLIWPALSGRSWRHTMAANLTAIVVRNVWSHSVIMCGHFPEGVETFEQESVEPDEGRGQWYLRQMLGSANATGPGWLHLLTGNLSHQIEHHLFPDLPSNRYAEIAPQVRELVERNGLRYHAAPLPRQVASAWHKVVRLSLPNDWWAETTWRTAGRRLRSLLTSPPPEPRTG